MKNISKFDSLALIAWSTYIHSTMATNVIYALRIA